jgi:hypothetical protein
VATSSSQQPALPPGLKYFLGAVEELLLGSAYLDTFVTSRRGARNVALPLPGSSNPSEITGLQVFGQARPLSVKTTVLNGGLRGAATLGSSRSGMSLRWVLAPDDAYLLPDLQPLPTLLEPAASQRFAMMDVEFRLDEEGRNAFQGFGAGRTYPTLVGGETQLWLGACGKVMSGTGVFDGVEASFVLNGRMTPPDGLEFEMLIRILDPAPGREAGRQSGFMGGSAASPGSSGPLAGSSYMTFLGEPDPAAPIRQEFTPGGALMGAAVTELLRVVRLEYHLSSGGRTLRAHHAAEDWIAGRLTTQIRFNPFDPKTPGTPASPMPWHTEDTTITFFDRRGKELGTIGADIDEGRGFLAQYKGFPGPALNLLGFGPFTGGTGRFSNARGMMSVNSGISVAPPTLSNLYVLRFARGK